MSQRSRTFADAFQPNLLANNLIVRTRGRVLCTENCREHPSLEQSKDFFAWCKSYKHKRVSVLSFWHCSSCRIAAIYVTTFQWNAVCTFNQFRSQLSDRRYAGGLGSRKRFRCVDRLSASQTKSTRDVSEQCDLAVDWIGGRAPFCKNGKEVFAASTDLHAAEIKKMKLEKDSIINVLYVLDRDSGPDEKRIKGLEIYSGLNLC